MKRWIPAALIVPAMLVSGCIPVHVRSTDWPSLDGKVTDSVSGKPIAGAAVKIKSTGADFSATTITDADGTFSFSRHEHEQWQGYEVPAGSFPAPVLSVTAPAHYPFEQRLDDTVSPESIALAPTQ